VAEGLAVLGDIPLEDHLGESLGQREDVPGGPAVIPSSGRVILLALKVIETESPYRDRRWS
jgi:hypothetical protein